MARKASEHVRFYQNPGGPTIGTMSRKIIENDGLFFKDIDGSGEVSTINDWRLDAEQRSEAYLNSLSLDEKIAQLFISDWRMGPKYPAPVADHVFIPDESGVLDDAEMHGKTIFGEQHTPGTTVLIKAWFARHLILRANPTTEDLVDYINQLNAIAEECHRYVPVCVVSNSRNENGEQIFGMNDANGVFVSWPGTLGIAAAVRGVGIDVADKWADCIKREWNGCGLKKGYMYMADVLTDPRWQRGYGTFGEDPTLVSQIMEHIVPRIQGSKEGATSDGVALTIKHFPGGGARENGFDPHYAAGQWNIYPTEGSLKKYHLPPFEAAVKSGSASIMPYYSKPSLEKSVEQRDLEGNVAEMTPYGFAFNRYFIDELLRKQIGFKGYVNSDTGIIHNMCWGVEKLDLAERIGFAVTNAGVDLISGLFDNESGREAYERGKNRYYESHPVPEGFEPEQLVLTDEAINRAVKHTLSELFRLGMFENPYRKVSEAVEAVSDRGDWEQAALAHHQSVVLLKNDGALPLCAEKLTDRKVYCEAFSKNPDTAKAATTSLRELVGNCKETTCPETADIAILALRPSSGAYFSATPGYLELDICENKLVPNVDELCRPTTEKHTETTLLGVDRIKEIADRVHKNGGKVIVSVNITMPWLLGNVEPYADALVVGFDTYPEAVMDVILGKFSPVGKLPITLPRSDEVLAVDENGRCISPNDIPGYDKDMYMPDSLKDENGKAYAYRDSMGNYYELDFGLRY